MGTEATLELLESLVFAKTGRHLNDLQRRLLQRVWQGQKYGQIARALGYTEGHIKDVAALLWQLLSQVLGERVTKSTLRSALRRRLKPAAPVPEGGPIGWSEVAPEPALPAAGPRLVGRAAAIADLNTLIGQGHRLLVIQGEGGLGKTTLAQHYLAPPRLSCALRAGA